MLPLNGVRVVAVEQYGAGPFGTTYLADLGADVIKIENPRENGELGRRVGPYFAGENDSHFYQAFNRNKRSLRLDLKTPQGQEVFRDLVATADGVLNNLRGDQPEKLGLTYAALETVKPAIVCVHLSAYGRRGSRSDWPGFDYLMQAEAGHMALTGEPDGAPQRYGLSVVDYMSGLTASHALLAGIIEARGSGTGRDFDVSLFDVALYNLGYQAVWYLNEGHIQERNPRSQHPSLVPCQLYTTRDGWIFVMCNKEKFWGDLARMLDHPEWEHDPRFESFAARLENKAEVDERLDSAFAENTTEHWLKHLGGRVPVAPVTDLAEALDGAFVAEQQRIFAVQHPERGEFRLLANPIRVDEPHPDTSAPSLGQNTDDVLTELGYPGERIAALKADGVI